MPRKIVELELSEIKAILKSPHKDIIEALIQLVKLSDIEYNILDLYYFHGLTLLDVADKMGFSDKTIQRKLSQIKKKLLNVWNANSTAIALARKISK